MRASSAFSAGTAWAREVEFSANIATARASHFIPFPSIAIGKSLWSVGIDTLKIRAQSLYITIGWVRRPAPDRHVW